ncbi:MAG: hypothetical protein E7644_02940 [Ruminococcaceae bacterium]|nr:hypothetical protein [Oscillospiraceae bacterium]
MKKNNTIFNKMIFGLQILFVLMIPFVIWWSNTPTNVLNSSSLYKLLEVVGILGSGLLPVGIHVGIIGIIMSKRMIKLRRATIVLSIINLSAGMIEIFIFLFVLFSVIFGGASV